MAQFKPFSDNVEVRGQAVISILAGMAHSKDRALKILSKHGIDNPTPEGWYSQRAFLEAFRDIAEEIGPYALYCIGEKVPEHAKFPPDIDSMEKALSSIHTAYHMNHRGGDIGSYEFHTAPDGAMRFVCRNPYPCEFDRGIIESLARRFAPAGGHVTVRHDDAAPCREKGDDSCSYSIDITP